MYGNKIILSLFVFVAFFSITQITNVNSQEEIYEDLFARLQFSPSIVEPGKATYSVGYVQLVDAEGSPFLAPEDLSIELISKDPKIASVPPEIIIPVNNDYTKFDVSVSAVEGETEISAIFQGQISNQTFRVGGINVDVPLNVELEINLPASNIHVGSSMPVSIFLNNSGTILQAPKDIKIHFEYEKALLSMQSDDVTIKKGNYYAITSIRTLDKTGSAFIKAITDEPPLENIQKLTVSSSLPTKLTVDVYPSSVIQKMDREIDIFVSLVDDDDNPVKAVEDVQFEFFSNLANFDDELTKKFMNVKPVIKKGQWGFYHKQENMLFNDLSRRNFVGVSSQIYGQALGAFSVIQELDEKSILAENKTLRLYQPTIMPSDSIGIIVYQLVAIKGNEDDQTAIDDLIEEGLLEVHPFTVEEDFEEGAVYPVKSNYDDFSHDDLKARVVTNNPNIIKIINGGEVSAKRTYGTAFIQSGKDGTTTISVGIKGLASASNATQVLDPNSPQKTLIYSPAGNDRIVFNNEGLADLYLVLLDSSSRPTISQSPISFYVKPLNELVEFPPQSNNVGLKAKSDFFARELESGQSIITTSPIGVNINTNLETQSLFEIAPASTTTNIILPFSKIVGLEAKTHNFGIIQLNDFFGNPVKVINDLRIELFTNDTKLVKIPSGVTIPASHSFVEFPITTFGETGKVSISAKTRGFYGSESVLELIPFVKELVIFPVYPSDPLNLGVNVQLQIFVDDENAVSVEGALLEFFPSSNSTVFPATITTDANGEANVLFTPGADPATLDIFATKNSYTPDQTTLEFELVSTEKTGTQTIFGIPPLYLYLAIGGAAAGGGIMALRFLRKPKVMTEEEAEEEEI